MPTQVAKIRVESKSPILMNSPVSMRRVSALERSGKKIPQPMEEARERLYMLPNKQLYIPADAFREACLIAAVDVRDESRKGRATMVRRFSATVFLTTDKFPLERHDGTPITSDEKDWELDTRRVVIQKQGILRSRPKIGEWATTVEFEYDDAGMQEELISSILEYAGKFPGILDYRVGKKGPFGRFTVVDIESLRNEPKKRSKK